MATMTVRTTVAFDPATAQRLERLARRWGVSKSETLRRALEAAEKDLAMETKSDFSKMTPTQALHWLQSHPTYPPGIGNRWSREIRRQRAADAVREQRRSRGHQ